MRPLFALLLALWPGLAVAQDNVELIIFGAMVEGPGGAPLASATGVGGEPGAVLYVTSNEAAMTEGACLRIWAEGACFALTAPRDLPGLSGLSVVEAPVAQDDMMAKMGRNPITRQPLVGVYDPATDGGLTYLTQNALGGWQQPLAPAQPAGQSGGAVILQSDGFSPLSVGAPLVHSEKGLVGVVARASTGAATLLPMTELNAALDAAGVALPDMMRPAAPGESGLPPRVETEVGRVIVFGDHSYIGYMGGFYGPSSGSGFQSDFVTTVGFSVWELDPGSGAARQITRADKVLPLSPAGQSLEADFSDTPGDYLVSCVTHTTPSSAGRPIVLLQFWRVAPERYANQIDDKAYDEAAPPLTGWADPAAPCQTAIAGVDANRRAALAGTQPAAAPSAPAPTAPPLAASGDWSALPTWPETSRPALTRPLPSGATLTLGCTALGELAVAVSPVPQSLGFAVADGVAMVTGATETAAFAVLSGEKPGSLRAIVDGQSFDFALPPGLLPCNKQ